MLFDNIRSSQGRQLSSGWSADRLGWCVPSLLPRRSDDDDDSDCCTLVVTVLTLHSMKSVVQLTVSWNSCYSKLDQLECDG